MDALGTDQASRSGSAPPAAPRMRGFRVPYGLSSDGTIVARTEAVRGRSYVCPACGSPLVWRSGAIRATHFAHRPEVACAPETALHQAAKLRIVAAVSNWINGSAAAPVIRRRCPKCGQHEDRALRGPISRAVSEFRVASDHGTYVADVALLDGLGQPRLVIEVLVHHAVEDAKAVLLSLMRTPWLELEAGRLEDPRVWQPLRLDPDPPVRCEPCTERETESRRRVEALAAAHGVELPQSDAYRAAVLPCWKCDREMVFLFWRLMARGVPPPEPRPRTLQIRYSQTVRRRYWANVCPHCDAFSGDFYLMNRWMAAFGESMVSALEWTAFVEGGEISEDYLAMTRLEEERSRSAKGGRH